MKENNLCTILVNSCDKYDDTWEPFFKLFKKYWPDCKFPIVLNTETKNYKYPGLNIKTLNVLGKKKNIQWGKRLKSVLKRIDSKYVIFMLDDFFFMDYVDSKRLDEVINWMEKDDNIGVFSFFRVEDDVHKDTKSKKYKDFYLRNQFGDYRYNCQAAVWNREFLIETLRDFESAWDWEINGNVRSYKSDKEFYTLMDPEKYIFKYDCELYGVVRGKWRLPYTEDLFKKENISVDFNIRNNRLEANKKINVIKRKWNSLKYRINQLRSRI